MRSYTAVSGTKFNIEWYIDPRGHSQAYEYFNELAPKYQDRVLALFKIMANRGKILNTTKFRYEGEQIYTFKTKQDRFLCFFFKGGKIIVTNAFTKKSNKMPTREKAKALMAYKNYVTRIRKGTYYEEEN